MFMSGAQFAKCSHSAKLCSSTFLQSIWQLTHTPTPPAQKPQTVCMYFFCQKLALHARPVGRKTDRELSSQLKLLSRKSKLYCR